MNWPLTGRFDQMQEPRDVSTLTQGIARVRQDGNRQGELSLQLWRSNGMKQGHFAREQDQKKLASDKKITRYTRLPEGHACCQTGRENTGTKMEMTAVKVVGNESITNDPFRWSDSWILIAGILPQMTEIG